MYTVVLIQGVTYSHLSYMYIYQLLRYYAFSINYIAVVTMTIFSNYLKISVHIRMLYMYKTNTNKRIKICFVYSYIWYVCYII